MSQDLQFGLIDLAIFRLETLHHRVGTFIDNKMVDNGIRDILDPVKSLLTSRGVAQSFIDALEIRKMGYLKIAFVINYIPGPGGVPLNVFLEFGTSPHPIYGNPWNAWTDDSGTHILFTAFNPINHPGFRGYHIIESMSNWGFVEIFVQRIIQEATEYMENVAFK